MSRYRRKRRKDRRKRNRPREWEEAVAAMPTVAVPMTTVTPLPLADVAPAVTDVQAEVPEDTTAGEEWMVMATAVALAAIWLLVLVGIVVPLLRR